jgi:acyl-coenzyme A synthetase/AMP-(fatty) acid ligase
VSGNQVAPAELENVLAAHPSIADQAVVGKPDERRGEIPWAFIVKKHEVSKEEVMEWVKVRTSKYKHLGGVTFVDQIAKNPSGKILKRVYRDMFKKEREGAAIKAKL